MSGNEPGHHTCPAISRSQTLGFNVVELELAMHAIP